MDISRRNFLRVTGLTGVALVTGQTLAEKQAKDESVEFYGMLYDAAMCKGCCGCEIDCADAHGLEYPEDSAEPGHVRKLKPGNRTIVNSKQTSKGEVFVKTQCMHCNDPACGTACLTEAMHKTIEGPVIWREDKCMGCRYCMVSCPFDVPKFDYDSTNPTIQKCDMCVELINEGEMPNCAYNCPTGALKFGKCRDLLAEAHHRIHEKPDLYVNHVYGEHEAGGTGWLYLSPVPFEELGLKTQIQHHSYPSLTKGFIASIAPVDILLPALLLGLHEATKTKQIKTEDPR